MVIFLDSFDAILTAEPLAKAFSKAKYQSKTLTLVQSRNNCLSKGVYKTRTPGPEAFFGSPYKTTQGVSGSGFLAFLASGPLRTIPDPPPDPLGPPPDPPDPLRTPYGPP